MSCHWLGSAYRGTTQLAHGFINQNHTAPTEETKSLRSGIVLSDLDTQVGLL
jgi:hypothetical protein